MRCHAKRSRRLVNLFFKSGATDQQHDSADQQDHAVDKQGDPGTDMGRQDAGKQPAQRIKAKACRCKKRDDAPAVFLRGRLLAKNSPAVIAKHRTF